MSLGVSVAEAAPAYTVSRTILPETNSTYDLGTSSKKWLRMFTDYFYASSSALINGTTTIGSPTDYFSLGIFNGSGVSAPIIKAVSAAGDFTGVLNNSWYVKEDPTLNTNPTFGLISDDLLSQALFSFATSTGSLTTSADNINLNATNLITLASGGTTTSNQGVNISSGCFAQGGVCVTSLFSDPNWVLSGGALTPTSSNVGIKSNAGLYDFHYGLSGVGLGSLGGTTTASILFSDALRTLFVLGPNQTQFDNPLVLASTTATSTGANGWNLTGGCFAVNSVCIGGSSGPSSPATSTNPLMATYFVATSTTQASYFSAGLGVTGATSTFDGIQINNPYGLQFQGYSGLPQVFAGDPTTGLHFDGPAILSFHNGGVQTMLLNALNNVGIGKTPSTRLDVSGTASSTDLYVNNRVGIATTSPAGSLAISPTLGVPPFIIASSSAGQPPSIFVDGTTGNVGFGTSTPPSRLTFTSVGSGNFQVGAMNDLGANYTAFSLNGLNLSSSTYNFASSPSDQNQTLFINTPLGGDIRFRENNGNFGLTRQDRVTFKANGNVGIGTSSPSNYLTLATTTDSDNSLVLLETKNVTVGTVPKGCVEFTTPISTLANQAFDSGRLCAGFVVPGTGYSRAGIYFQYPLAQDSWRNGIILRGTGNVGIATDTPMAKLSVHAMYDDTNKFLFTVASSTANSTTTLFNVDNTGNVAIGTTTPSVRLDVSGTTTIRGTQSATLSLGTASLSGINRAAIIPSDPTNNDTDALMIGGSLTYISNVGTDHTKEGEHLFTLNFYDEKSGAIAAISMSTSTIYAPTTQLSFNPGSGNSIYANVSGGGNFGIASSSPFSTLSVGGDAWLDNPSSATTRLRMESSEVLRNDGATQYVGNVSGTSLPTVIRAGGADRIYASNSSTLVGIGTTTPARTLTVWKSGSRGELFLADNAAGNVDSTTQGGTYLSSEQGLFKIQGMNSQGSGSGIITTVDQVNSRYGVATNTPWRTLSVTGTVSFDGLTSTSTPGDSLCLSNKKDVTVRTNNTCSAASSIRFKKDIEPLTVGLGELLKLKPITYNYKDDYIGENRKNDPNWTSRQEGFIAEEVSKIDPLLITRDNTGQIDGIHYDKMVALITKSIQEFYNSFVKLVAVVKNHETRIEKLERENAELKVRLSKLENKLK